MLRHRISKVSDRMDQVSPDFTDTIKSSPINWLHIGQLEKEIPSPGNVKERDESSSEPVKYEE